MDAIFNRQPPGPPSGQDPHPVGRRGGTCSMELGGHPCFGLISLGPWCKGPQEQQLLNREGCFCLSLDPSSPGDRSPLSHPPVFQAADAVGEILLSLSYLPTAERLTVVVVKAKNLLWTHDKATAGKAPLAAWLLHTAGGSCGPAATPWAPGGISKCGHSARPPSLLWLSSGAMHSRKINLAGGTQEPQRGTGSPCGQGTGRILRAEGSADSWGAGKKPRWAPSSHFGIHGGGSAPRGWNASQVPHGDQGHWDNMGTRQDLMPQVCRSL